MKRTLLALLVSTSVLVALPAYAATLYWDGGNVDILSNGNGASAGGAGTWNTTLQNWDQGNALPHTNWSSGDYAVIAGTGATISVGSGVVASGIDFLGNSYVLDATSNGFGFTSGSNQMRIAGNNWQATINGSVISTGSMHIQAIHTGTLGVNPPPTINFGGTSAGGWQGATTITRAAVLAMSGDSQVLNSTSGITLNGGIIQLTNTSATAITNNRINDSAAITINNGGLIRITNTNTAGNVYSENIGDVTLNSGYASFHYTVNLSTTGTTQTLILDSFTRNNNSVVSFGPSGNSAGVIQVTGASQTAANEVIGPWAIHGNGNTDNDFAVYNASGQVVGRNASNTAEASWTTAWSATANIASNSYSTLSANRALNTLRITNNNGVLDVADKVLATYGYLNGAGNHTINATANGGTGFISIPTDNGDQALYLHSGNGNLTVNAPIKDNGSTKLTLVLGGGGASTQTILNGNNTYSGGTVIAKSAVRNSATSGSGPVVIGNNSAFGDTSNYLRFDSGVLNLQTFDVTVGEFSGGPSSYITASAGGSMTVGTGTSSASSTEFKGLITGGEIVKVGDGRLTLSGHNTAAATTAQYTVNGGTLQFGKIVSFFGGTTADTTNTANWTKARTIVNSGGTLAFNVGGTGEFTTGNVTTLLSNLAGSNAASEGFQAGSRIGFDTTNAAGGSFTIADAIADSIGAGGGAIGLTKLGTGTLVLTNTNTYTGPTTVTAGKLLVNGSTASGSAATVASGATLGGIGTIGGTVGVSGILSPGASIESLVSGALTMNSGSTFMFEAVNNSATGADVMIVGGALSLTNVTLDLTGANLAAGTWLAGDKLTLMSYTGSAITGGFAGYINNSQYTFGTNGWTIRYNDTTEGGNFASEVPNGVNYVTLQLTAIVPEPSSMSLIAVGGLLMLRRRRRG